MLGIRRRIKQLEVSLSEKRRLLYDESSGWIKFLGLESLVHTSNQLVDKLGSQAVEDTGRLNQVKPTLGAIQEAVLIFDSARRIEFANEPAQKLFPQSGAMKGARLESILRSSSFLQFLDAYRENKQLKRMQVSLESRGDLLWFEASCTELKGLSDEESISTLLVLHDITRLKSLEEIRREFVANVSHELRTPLTIIKGFAETLAEDEASLDRKEQNRFIHKIVDNAQRLHVLVEDLMSLSRLESRPDSFERTEASLEQLLRETIENNEGRLNLSEQVIVLEMDPQIKPFGFDPYRIHQVLDNLVENVFRYAPEFSRLVLRAHLDASSEYVECSVKDDGPGIPEKDLPHIFERFYRVDKGRSRERGGTGLGLSIMKHIVQLHGGSVAVDSVLGEGTCIHFTLPYKPAPEVPIA
ncbi:MAG: Alkaline phosphatase synthesis sensor protein PhoR [Opitutia bacterium UBA7350]|nr:MAG: Alkaline phosphatase synthesis sensor protein PhoR [Opitutae bacterium UBA7350]